MSEYRDIVEESKNRFGCYSCLFREGDICRHDETLAPISMLARCPVSGVHRPIERMERTKIEKPDRSFKR